MRRQAAKVMAFVILAAIAAVVLATAPHPPLSATSNITLNYTVQTAFPDSITFGVKAQSDANVTKLRLHYVVNKQNFTSVVSEGWAQFIPTKSVDSQWFWDMRKSSLPVGTKVQYWWTAEDAAGKTAESAHSTISFDDNRYNWQSITTSPVTLQWYNGSTTFANDLMNAAQQGLQRIASNTGAVPKGSVRIYIYGSALDFQRSQLFAQAWEGGVTFEGYDIIAIGVSPSELVTFGVEAVPHELTHWVVGQITFNNYGAGLPTWLDEGLATYGESTTLNPRYQSALDFAIKNNLLFSVRTLSSPFSAIPQEAFISYGESNSLVTFLIQKYGKDKMVKLLEVFHQGSTYDNALKQVYGFDQDGLDTLWRQSLGIKTTVFTPGVEPAAIKSLRLSLAASAAS